jgi:hypothetical protein
VAELKAIVEKNGRLPKRRETGGRIVNRIRANKEALTATQKDEVEAIPHWSWGNYDVVGWDAHVRSLEEFIKVHRTADVRNQDFSPAMAPAPRR